MSDDVRNTQRWCSFYNASGETIPAYGVINLVSDKGASSDTVNFCRRLVGKKFSSSDDNGLYALNSRFPVPAGQYGECTFARSAPAFAAISQVDLGESVDISADDDWIGQDWGPVEGKWTIGSGGGFVLMARPDVDYVDGFSRVLVLAVTPSDEDWLVTYRQGLYEDGVYVGSPSYDQEDDRLCGNRDIVSDGGDVEDSVRFTMSASRVKKWHVSDMDHYDYPEEVDPEFEELINGKWYDKLIQQGELVYCKRRVYQDGDDVYTYWMPLRGGTAFFPYGELLEDMDNEDGTDDGECKAKIYIPLNPLNHKLAGTNAQEADWSSVVTGGGGGWAPINVRVAAPLTNEPIPSGTTISVAWHATGRKLVIIGLGCPYFPT